MRCVVFLQWGLCVSCEEGSGDFLRWIWTISYYIICLHFKFQFLKHILLSFQCYHVNIVFPWCVCVVGHYHCVIEMIAFTFTAWSVWSVLPCSWGTVENIRYVWSQFKCHVFFPNNWKTSNCTNISFSDFSGLSDPRVACSKSSSAAYWTQYFCCKQ